MNKHVDLLVDASPFGVGALLAQDGKVVNYASKSLNDVEKRYSQIERESLAILYAIEKFQLYLIGANFTVYSDHHPLQKIFNHPRSKPTARIERWLLRLQQYTFEVIYQKGVNNPADYLSRHPNDRSNKHNFTEFCINYLILNCLPPTVKLEEVIDETSKDTVITLVKESLKTQRWHIDNEDLK